MIVKALVLTTTLLYLSFATAARNLQLECSDGEEGLYWQILLDGRPEETSWTLVCDGVEQWNAAGIEAKTWAFETACVANNVTLCTFTLRDAAGDGLSADGWYSLTHGATTLGVAEYGSANPFSEVVFCLGTECDQSALETGNDVAGDEEDYELECQDGEKEVSWDILFDAEPEETGWSLQCEDDMVWSVPALSYSGSSANTWATHKACVTENVTLCTFTLQDSDGDGLGEDAYYLLKFGARTVAVSNEASSFTELSFCFGTDCDTNIESMGDEEDDAVLECQDDEKEVSWDILFDSEPEQTGWNLFCEGDMIFNVPPLSYSGENANSWATQRKCVKENVTLCTFALQDSAGDGLDEDSYYLLKFGAETVAVSNEASSFTELSFCFGTECNTCDNPFLFEIELNDKPEETGFHLACDGQVLFEHVVGDTASAFDIITKKECIDPMACCEIQVLDSGNDGIYYGSFQVKIGDEVMYYYDGSTQSYHFSEWSLIFTGDQYQGVCDKVTAGSMPV